MKCPECLAVSSPKNPQSETLRAIPHSGTCSYWDQPPVFIETLVTAWDLDVRAFFAALSENNLPPGSMNASSSKTLFREAVQLADEAEKIRREHRGDDLPWEPKT
jgi:hypothetical protein